MGKKIKSERVGKGRGRNCEVEGRVLGSNSPSFTPLNINLRKGGGDSLCNLPIHSIFMVLHLVAQNTVHVDMTFWKLSARFWKSSVRFWKSSAKPQQSSAIYGQTGVLAPRLPGFFHHWIIHYYFFLGGGQFKIFVPQSWNIYTPACRQKRRCVYLLYVRQC